MNVLILDFLKSYYKEIIEVSVLLISVVICLIRKRPTYNKMDVIKKDVLELLPTLISMVEVPGNGAQKKSTVMSLISNFVKKKYSIDLPEEIVSLVDEAIENILSTPKKK